MKPSCAAILFGVAIACLLAATSHAWTDSVPSGKTCGSSCPTCPAPAAPTTATWSPPTSCTQATDPNNMPASSLESWFTEADFNYLFYYANQGHGPSNCAPYNYKAFVIAARYFPEFGQIVNGDKETAVMDVAGFLAQMIQETGRNMMDTGYDKNCIFRGGLYHWFEGGENCGLTNQSDCYNPWNSNNACTLAYCFGGDYGKIFPCGSHCYFGRGPLQLSYNSNYGNFMLWANSVNINVDLLTNPGDLISKLDPPLAFMGSLWYYMTAQANKFSMHTVIRGTWNPNAATKSWVYAAKAAAGKAQDMRAFGPLNYIINGECSASAPDPMGTGEPRRRAAFTFFCSYFGVDSSLAEPTSCSGMPGNAMTYCEQGNFCSWYPSTSNTDGTCTCTAQTWDSPVLYQPTEAGNTAAKKRCETYSSSFCALASGSAGGSNSGGGTSTGTGTLGSQCQAATDCASGLTCSWWAASAVTVTGAGGSCTYGPTSTAGCCTGTPTTTCPANCVTCSSSTVCTQCSTGYTKYTSGTSTLCQQTTTVTCPANCDTCSSSTVCTTCSTGYTKYTSGTSTLCQQTTTVTCPANCATCSSSTVCTTCSTGYTKYTSGTSTLCQQTTTVTCPANCATCSSSTVCTTCSTGYTKYTSGTSTLCQKTATTVSSTASSSQPSPSPSSGTGLGAKCLSAADCASGMTCTWWAASAVTVTGSAGSCTYGPTSTSYGCCTGTATTTCPANCATCSSSTVCTTCSSGYTKYTSGTSTLCQKSSSSTCPANCVACSSSTVCTTCAAGYARYTSGTKKLCKASVGAAEGTDETEADTAATSSDSTKIIIVASGGGAAAIVIAAVLGAVLVWRRRRQALNRDVKEAAQPRASVSSVASSARESVSEPVPAAAAAPSAAPSVAVGVNPVSTGI